MTRFTPTSVLLPLLALGLSIPLAGCVSFGAKPPPQLLSLSSDTQAAPGQLRTAHKNEGVVVLMPEVVRKLDNPRVAVQIDDTSVAYVAKAQWVDMPRRMFRDLLAEKLRAGGDIVVLDPDQSTLEPRLKLTGRLIDFGVDARSNQAVVTFDAVVVKADAQTVVTQRFTASAPLGGKAEGPVAARAINQAANKVASDVLAWAQAQ